jgi:hypothetical protein
VRFVARLNATTSIAPGVELTVSQIEGQRLDADVRTAAGTIPVRSQSLLQIVPIDSASGRDLIFTAADEGSVTGYVLLPKP